MKQTEDKWTGLWDFGYLGVAYVSSLEILYVLRKLLSLMEIWEGCMHFKREVGGSSLKAWTTKPGLSSWNKQKKNKKHKAKLHTSNMVYQYLCIFPPNQIKLVDTT